MNAKARRLIVGISGASGAILGIRLLEILRQTDVESHLVVTPAAQQTIREETDRTEEQVLALADFHYDPADVGARLASGAFQTMGMAILPCSIKTLSAVANAYSADLLARAADVTLKEGRPLILGVRETPLHAGHLRLMSLAAQAGAIIFPPVPAFYARPQGMQEIIDTIVGRVLLRLGIENEWYARWPR